MFYIYVLYMLAMNLLAFGLMFADKRFAQRRKWRIPERTLFFVAALGGSLGGVLGMRLFRHKTKHWYFVFGFTLLLLVHIALSVFLFCAGILQLP